MFEIVQNIGRALRPRHYETVKGARIIAQVFLQPGEDPTHMVACASYKPLVPAGAKSTTNVIRTDGWSAPTLGAEVTARTGTAPFAAAESALLYFSAPRDAATIAASAFGSTDPSR
ncbi:hypothetical protein ACFWAR_26425 [Streptomyces sp. NPDC059917]|uniref:hypothetical protein n=1 Tax=Streptomyces sp. NPDC059917 TaxID=3347002 RepID=UPI003653E3FD